MGQLPPNHKVKFQQISMEEALKARKAYQAKLEALQKSLQ